jgi:competence protein ComEC
MRVFLLMMFILVSLVLAISSQLPDKNLHIVICDVGQGDGMLIQKGSTQIVIDGGPDNSILHCLGKHMPFWDRTIEIAFMTHADSDHYYGFSEIIMRYHVQNFVASTVDNPTSEYIRLKAVVEQSAVPVTAAQAGKIFKVDGVSFKILFPQSEYVMSRTTEGDASQVLGSRTSNERNDLCALGLLTYGNFTGLFTCDLSPASGEEMVKAGIVPRSYFLKVSHHGSKNGLTQSFLNAVQPTIAAISVGRKNRYGHPSSEIINMLENAGVKIYRTDEVGDIELVTNGQKIWIK